MFKWIKNLFIDNRTPNEKIFDFVYKTLERDDWEIRNNNFDLLPPGVRFVVRVSEKPYRLFIYFLIDKSSSLRYKKILDKKEYEQLKHYGTFFIDPNSREGEIFKNIVLDNNDFLIMEML